MIIAAKSFHEINELMPSIAIIAVDSMHTMSDVKPLSVVSFDPGVTTGFAKGSISEGLMKVSTGQIEFTHLGLWSNLQMLAPDVIIYEKFEYRNRAREGLVLYSLELIGIMELYAQLESTTGREVLIYRQQPGNVIGGYFSNLKKDPVYKPGKIHANEACMHLLYWFTFGPGFKYNSRGYEPLGK